MGTRYWTPFGKKSDLGTRQSNHVFVICGPASYERAKSLYEKNQCQPAIPIPENISPELCPWEVNGKDVTICNLGSADNFTEDLVCALLKAGATLVVNANQSTGQVNVYRPEGFLDAA